VGIQGAHLDGDPLGLRSEVVTLTRGGFFAETIDDLDDDFAPEVPDSIPRHGDPRKAYPKIRRIDDPTQFAWYQRASKLGKPIESAYLLDRAERRQVAYGMGRRPDLVMEAAALADLEEPGNKRVAERIADDAIVAAGGGQAARKGTAFHKLRERRDAGEDLSHLGPEALAALDAWSAIADRFTWHGSEQFVVCDRWQAAGTYDALWSPRWPMTAPDGTRVLPGERLIVDLKSGAWGRDMWGAGYLAQLAVYANGVPYVHVDDAAAEGRLAQGFDPAFEPDNGRRSWPDGFEPRQDWALIPHVPVDSPEDAELVWVDLRIGARMAEHAATIMADRKAAKDGFAPAELPAPPVEAGRERIELGAYAGVLATVDAIDRHPPMPGEPGYCPGCDYDTHRCGGCGAPTTHEQGNDCGGHLLDHIAYAEDGDELTRLWQLNVAVWTDEHTAAVQARLAQLSNGSTEVRTS
jgi:hypothetical protein